ARKGRERRMIIGIVADDLTGAADSVAPFARRGLQASVCFSIGHKPGFCLAEGDALAFTTNTRDAPAQPQGYITTVVRRAARRLKACAPILYYKKIDSTLRGHLRLELDAMRRELPDRLA